MEKVKVKIHRTTKIWDNNFTDRINNVSQDK
jgi:hypothetical protein